MTGSYIKHTAKISTRDVKCTHTDKTRGHRTTTHANDRKESIDASEQPGESSFPLKLKTNPRNSNSSSCNRYYTRVVLSREPKTRGNATKVKPSNYPSDTYRFRLRLKSDTKSQGFTSSGHPATTTTSDLKSDKTPLLRYNPATR